MVIINYYIEIKEELINNEITKRVKDYSKNRSDLNTYYNVGKLLFEAGKHYGESVIKEYSKRLTNELGEGFTYIKSEYKIKIGDRYNYIDLLLYNINYNCYVVIELKVTELKKEHIGQIETYMNYIDRNIRRIEQDKTIGIIICKKDNKFIMEYCSDDRIYQRMYELV